MAVLGPTGRAGALLLLAITTRNIHGMAEGTTATTILANPATTASDVILTADGSNSSPHSSAILATEPVSGLFYFDNVVDEASIAMLKTRFNLTMQTPSVDGRRRMDVPIGVVASLETALQHRRLDLVMMQNNRTGDDSDNYLKHGQARFQLPIQEHKNGFGNHKDHYHRSNLYDKRVVVEGQVGLLYLDGDGQMIFTNDETKAETSIGIVAGRFIAWDNAAFTHRVVHGPSNTMRRMLGPVTWNNAAQEETRKACGGVATSLSLKAKASRAKIGARRGGKITYTVRLKNRQAFE
eukprot:evm.model.NODE_41505_length_5242_cov_29.579359.1